MPARDPQYLPVRTAIALGVIVLLFLLQAGLCAGGLIDDASISFRYALNWSEGFGLTYNRGDTPVEGFTNFSWVALSALIYLFGGDALTWIPILGTASGVGWILTVFFLSRRVAARSVDLGPGAGLFAAALLAFNPSVVLYSVSGLESVFYGWLIVALLGSAFLRLPVLFSFLGLVSVLTRPEALAWVGVGSLVFLSEGIRHARSRPRILIAALLLATGLGAYAFFKWRVFGELVPNTFYAKPPATGLGWSYVLPGMLHLLPAALVAALGLRYRHDLSIAWPWLGSFALAVSIVIATGGDWMPFSRRLLAGLGLLAVALDLLVQQGIKRYSHRVRALGGLLFFVYLALSFKDTYRAKGYLDRIAEYDPVRVSVAESLVARDIQSIATFDIGVIGLAAPDMRILDLGGLTDRSLARQPGNRHMKPIPEAYFRDWDADALLITSREPLFRNGGLERGIMPAYQPEHQLLALPTVRKGYRAKRQFSVAEDLYLVLFLREKDAPKD